MKAGQALLCKEGIAGMRLSKLTRKLHVSTGSFYHHFIDMDDFLGELANYYNTDQVEALIAAATSRASDPLEQIRIVGSESRKKGLFALDAAMRVWASSDVRAASSMRQSERVVMEFLTNAFKRLGFDEAQSEVRARMLLSLKPPFPEAQYRLAILYLKGIGMKQDADKARKLLDSAAASGYAPAAQMLASM